MSLKSTPFVFSSIVLVAASAALLGCHHASAPQGASVASTPPGEVWLTPDEVKSAKVEVQAAAEQPVDDTLITSGRVTFDDLRVAHVYSPITGRAVRINAQLGERVKKGQALTVIESPDIGVAVSDVRKAEADLVAAEHDFKRRQELYAHNAGAKADLEAAEDTYRKSKAELERARQKAYLLRSGGVDAVTQTYTLASPIDGEVIMRQVNPGIEVQGQYGGGTAVELFTVGELDRVWVLGDVYESDISRVHVGERAAVKIVTHKDRVFEGTVDWVSGALDPMTRTVKVRVTLDNSERLLKPEMYATIQIAVQERRTLAIPRTSVVTLGETNVVFVQLDDAEGKQRFERLPVTIDDVGSSNWLVVQHGLDPGQRVVTSGAATLSARL